MLEMITRTVVMSATRYMPVPQARPIAAVTQSPAAVVIPLTFSTARTKLEDFKEGLRKDLRDLLSD